MKVTKRGMQYLLLKETKKALLQEQLLKEYGIQRCSTILKKLSRSKRRRTNRKLISEILTTAGSAGIFSLLAESISALETLVKSGFPDEFDFNQAKGKMANRAEFQKALKAALQTEDELVRYLYSVKTDNPTAYKNIKAALNSGWLDVDGIKQISQGAGNPTLKGTGGGSTRTTLTQAVDNYKPSATPAATPTTQTTQTTQTQAQPKTNTGIKGGKGPGSPYQRARANIRRAKTTKTIDKHVKTLIELGEEPAKANKIGDAYKQRLSPASGTGTPSKNPPKSTGSGGGANTNPGTTTQPNAKPSSPRTSWRSNSSKFQEAMKNELDTLKSSIDDIASKAASGEMGKRKALQQITRLTEKFHNKIAQNPASRRAFADAIQQGSQMGKNALYNYMDDISDALNKGGFADDMADNVWDYLSAQSDDIAKEGRKVKPSMFKALIKKYAPDGNIQFNSDPSKVKQRFNVRKIPGKFNSVATGTAPSPTMRPASSNLQVNVPQDPPKAPKATPTSGGTPAPKTPPPATDPKVQSLVDDVFNGGKELDKLDDTLTKAATGSGDDAANIINKAKLDKVPEEQVSKIKEWFKTFDGKKFLAGFKKTVKKFTPNFYNFMARVVAFLSRKAGEEAIEEMAKQGGKKVAEKAGGGIAAKILPTAFIAYEVSDLFGIGQESSERARIGVDGKPMKGKDLATEEKLAHLANFGIEFAAGSVAAGAPLFAPAAGVTVSGGAGTAAGAGLGSTLVGGIVIVFAKVFAVLGALWLGYAIGGAIDKYMKGDTKLWYKTIEKMAKVNQSNQAKEQGKTQSLGIGLGYGGFLGDWDFTDHKEFAGYAADVGFKGLKPSMIKAKDVVYVEMMNAEVAKETGEYDKLVKNKDHDFAKLAALFQYKYLDEDAWKKGYQEWRDGQSEDVSVEQLTVNKESEPGDKKGEGEGAVKVEPTPEQEKKIKKTMTSSWKQYIDKATNKDLANKVATGWYQLKNMGIVSDTSFKSWVKFYNSIRNDAGSLKDIGTGKKPGGHLSMKEVLKAYEVIAGGNEAMKAILAENKKYYLKKLITLI